MKAETYQEKLIDLDFYYFAGLISEEEYLTRSRAIQDQELQPTRICAWHQIYFPDQPATIKAGNPDLDPSHTICDECTAKLLKERHDNSRTDRRTDAA